jgi:hypothetical protein
MGTTQTLYAEGLHRAEIEGSDENSPPQSNSGSGGLVPLPQKIKPRRSGARTWNEIKMKMCTSHSAIAAVLRQQDRFRALGFEDIASSQLGTVARKAQSNFLAAARETVLPCCRLGSCGRGGPRSSPLPQKYLAPPLAGRGLFLCQRFSRRFIFCGCTFVGSRNQRPLRTNLLV